MRRREFLLTATAIIGARAVRAQQKTMPVIGFLSSASLGQIDAYLAAFRQGLAETGYVEGQNVSIKYRLAENHYDRLPGLAALLVGREADVIATNGGEPSAFEAKKATSDDPDRFCRRPGPGCDWVGRQFCAAKRRPHWVHHSQRGTYRQVARAALRPAPLGEGDRPAG